MYYTEEKVGIRADTGRVVERRRGNTGFLEMGVNRSARRFNCWKPGRGGGTLLSLSRARRVPLDHPLIQVDR